MSYVHIFVFFGWIKNTFVYKKLFESFSGSANYKFLEEIFL